MAGFTPQFGKMVDVIMTITPQDLAVDGTYTDNAIGSFVMTGRIDEHTEEASVTTENLSPGHFFQGNPVPNEQNAALRISEYVLATALVASASKTLKNGNVLRVCARTSFYWKVVVQQKDRTPSTIETATYIVLVTTPVSRSTTKGKVMDSVSASTIILVDSATGAAIPNPSYS